MPEVDKDEDLANRIEAKIRPALIALALKMELLAPGDPASLPLAELWKMIRAAQPNVHAGRCISADALKKGEELVNDVGSLRHRNVRWSLGALFVDPAIIDQRVAEFVTQIEDATRKANARSPHGEGIW